MKDKNNLLTIVLSVLVVYNMWRSHNMNILDIIILLLIAANIIVIIKKVVKK